MFVSRSRCLALLSAAILTASVAGRLDAQLVWQQEMEDYSAVLPLTLDNNVYRIRAKPPEGIKPREITCDIGITGTVLTDERVTSTSDPGEKVVGGLWSHDDIDVYFTDRVYTGNRDYAGNRIVRKYDFDCGINIKYETKRNVAQVEIRVGYILPSGDIEGLTWLKLRRKQRIYQRNIAKCGQYRREIGNLHAQTRVLARSADNSAEHGANMMRIASIERQIARKQKFVDREAEFRRDLAAFASIGEYLKTKVNGCQVYVHFHHDGETLAVDLDELKRSRIRPIQVFEHSKDPIKQRVSG